MPPKKKQQPKKRPKKKAKAGHKGAKSKTHKGDMDYTTKRGDGDFHRGGHNIKERIDPYQTLTRKGDLRV